jgi:hypothetical protein
VLTGGGCVNWWRLSFVYGITKKPKKKEIDNVSY